MKGSYNERLACLLDECTMPLPSGTQFSDTLHNGYALVEMVLVTVAVDEAKAGYHRNDFLALLHEYPYPEELASGPSYIAVGATVGDQLTAFRFMALGKVLKLWDVITPLSLGFEGEEAKERAGLGYVLISGWEPR
jgi:hypothetical protein